MRKKALMILGMCLAVLSVYVSEDGEDDTSVVIQKEETSRPRFHCVIPVDCYNDLGYIQPLFTKL